MELSEIISFEKQGDYLQAALGYLKKYKSNQEFSIYIDGLFRCISRLDFEEFENDIHSEFFIEIKNIFGFIPKRKGYGSPKLAFVDHSYHTKTLSSMFFVELLQQKFDVHIFWRKDWLGISSEFPKSFWSCFDAYVFWQVFPPKECKSNWSDLNLTIVPMWDAVCGEPDDFFYTYKNCKFISFSETLEKRLNNLNIDSLRAYPRILSPKMIRQTKSLPTILFWQRIDQVNWNRIKKLFKPEQVGRILICQSPDPSHRQVSISDEEMKCYKVQLQPWISMKSEYLRLLDSVDLFIAPRLREGIGYSFLDAMARGCIPIAHDAPTMNEFITSDVGYLSNFESPVELNLEDFTRKREALYKHMLKLESIWFCNSKKILDYIEV